VNLLNETPSDRTTVNPIKTPGKERTRRDHTRMTSQVRRAIHQTKVSGDTFV